MRLNGILTAACTGIAALALMMGQGQADTLKVRYGVSILGLSIGSASLVGNFDAGSYRIEANTKLSGLAALMSSSKGAATATGSFARSQTVPATYATTSANADISRTVRMSMGGGAVKAMDVAPPFEDHAGRIPLTEEHKRGIIDPLSAVVMAVPAGQPLLGPAACNRSLPVFDGYTRFDVTLAYVGTRQVKARGYAGPVAVCAARYVPIAGHRPDRKATKFMTDNKQLEVWLAPVEKAHVAVPFRISVLSQIGTVVIEAQDFVVEPSGQAAGQ